MPRPEEGRHCATPSPRHMVVMQEVSVPGLRALVPARGNPMRPIVILVAVAFGLMLIVFPIVMQIGGVGTGGTIGVTLLIVVVAVVCLAVLRVMTRAYEGDRFNLLASEAWVQWHLSPEEYQHFVADERRRFERQATGYGLAGLVLGLAFGGILNDWLLGLIMFGIFLGVAIVILTMVRPSAGARNPAAREVRIGARGVHLLGGYVPLQGPGTRPFKVQLQPGDPAVLRFDVRTGRRVDEVRVPVPRDRVPEVVMERLQRELG